MYNLVQAVRAKQEFGDGPYHAADRADTTIVNIWRDNSILVGRFRRFKDKECQCDYCHLAVCNYYRAAYKLISNQAKSVTTEVVHHVC